MWCPRKGSIFKGRDSEITSTPCFEISGFHVTALVKAGPLPEEHGTSTQQMPLPGSTSLRTPKSPPRGDLRLPRGARHGHTRTPLLQVRSARLGQMVSFRVNASNVIIFTFVFLAGINHFLMLFNKNNRLLHFHPIKPSTFLSMMSGEGHFFPPLVRWPQTWAGELSCRFFSPAGATGPLKD